MPSFVHRYASLYFCLAVENQENELLGLEVIHRYVELLDKYFGNVIPSRVTTCAFTYKTKSKECCLPVFFAFLIMKTSLQVCELDLIFNFEKAYFILDEFLMGGEVQETSKQTVNRCIEASDMLQEVRRAHDALVHDALVHDATQGKARALPACNK